MAVELPTIPFASAESWEGWLDEHHASSEGVWIKLAKKGSGIPSVTYAEALEVSLCYGWIDGQAKGIDEKWWMQKFTPRRKRSIWSRKNRDAAEELLRVGRMKEAGEAAITSAKADGRWEAAYDRPSTATVPDDLRSALDRSARASETFESLSKSSRFAIIVRLQTARKPETRLRRLEAFIARLERGEVNYP